MTDDMKEQPDTYCSCGRPKRYWHSQCEVCMGAMPDPEACCNGTEASYKQEPKIKEGRGHE